MRRCNHCNKMVIVETTTDILRITNGDKAKIEEIYSERCPNVKCGNLLFGSSREVLRATLSDD
jgi:hypothetical protein